MSQVLPRFALALTVLLASAGVTRAATITVYTDQGGGNTQIDVTHTSIWNFSALASIDDITGYFVIKRGVSTFLPINFSLYSGFDLGGEELGTTSLTADSVSTSYSEHAFTLDGLGPLTAPGDYSVTLWSDAATTGNYQYFFKGDSDNTLSVTPCAIADVPCVANGSTESGTTGGSEGGTTGDVTGGTDGALGDASNAQALPIAHAPEPATLLLFGSGLVFGALTLRRRRSKEPKNGLI